MRKAFTLIELIVCVVFFLVFVALVVSIVFLILWLTS
jgi:hypothetical protein